MSKVRAAVGSGIARRAIGAKQRCRSVRLVVELLRRKLSLRHRHRAREPAAHEEPLLERLPHVAHLPQALAEVSRADLRVVRVERADSARVLAALERRVGGLCGKAPGFDRVVNTLQPREVDESRALAGEQQARRAESTRHCMPATARDRLRPPGNALPSLEDLADEGVRLELLEEIVRRQLDVAVVEPDHEAERHHLITHRVDPRAAELAVLGRLAQRPPERVDDPAERLRDAPDLLDPELPDLRFRAVEAEVVERRSREVARRALGQHRHLRNDVRARLEVAERLGLLPTPLVAAANPDDAAVLDEQPVGRGLRQHERAAGLRLLREIAGHLRDRDDPVAVVAERRRRRNAEGTLSCEEVDALAGNLSVGRHSVELLRAALEQPPDRPGVHDGAREKMRAGLLALVDERDRDVAELLGHRGVVLEELPEPDRARKARRAAAHDQDTDLDALVRCVGRSGDHLAARERWRKVRRAHLCGRLAPGHVSGLSGESCHAARGCKHIAGLRPRSHPYNPVWELPASSPCSVFAGAPRQDPPERPLRLTGPHELGELRRDLVQVADDAEVGEVEDGRVRVLVDRDDRAGVLHAHLVLDRARDPERDVELR